MGGEWREEVFSNLCDITRGGSPRPINDYIRKEGIPWIKIADATAAGARYIDRTKEFIRPAGKSKSREVFPGDLILSNSATPGLPMIMSIYGCIHDGWLLLRNFRGLDKGFCYYLLLHNRISLVRFGNGSVFTNLKTDILKNHKVKIPPFAEQRSIADILGTLDDKIELNHQMNRTLEAIARAIFKAWFVDFEPVKAKAAGATSFCGMPQAVFDQLPNRFSETELGPLPEGWEIRSLVEVTDYLKRGITPKYTEKGGVCVINQRCIRDHWVDIAQSRRHDHEIKSVEGKELRPLDVLVNSTGVGTLGRVAQILSLSEKTVVDSHVTVVRANPEEVLPECIGYDLSFREDEIEMLGHGSTGQTELLIFPE